LGATGKIGRHLVDRLVAADHTVTAYVRTHASSPSAIRTSSSLKASSTTPSGSPSSRTEALADRGIYVAHVPIDVWIGRGSLETQPDAIPRVHWTLYTQRDTAERLYSVP
jgi:nucleoside-diphosphate-sugar epimerase